MPGKFHGQRSLAGYSPWGCKEADTTEWLTHTQWEVRTSHHYQHSVSWDWTIISMDIGHHLIPIQILPYTLCLQIPVKLNHLVLMNFSFMSTIICIYITSFISNLCVCVYMYIYMHIIYITLSNLYLLKVYKGSQHLFEAIFT